MLGRSDHPEFAPALRQLERRYQVFRPLVPVGSEFDVPSDSSAPSAPAPDLVVFLVERPGRLARDVADRWLRRFPLVRLTALLGGWCEGETRSGRPAPGVLRVYWHQGVARWSETDESFGGDSADRALPLTASETERLDESLRADRVNLAAARTDRPRSAALFSDDREAWEAAADACRACGWVAHRWSDDDVEPPESDVVVYDLRRAPDFDDATWRRRRQATGGRPALALVGFPRWQDRRAAATVGVELLAKPWRLVDFRLRLERLIDGSPSRCTEPIE